MSDSDRFHRFAIIMLAALLILLISLLHAQVYGQRNYREDEINTVHAALRMTPAEITRWMAGDVHPPGWRLLADLWLDAFGVDEALARWSSKLINLLTFALVFQLGCQLLDGRAGAVRARYPGRLWLRGRRHVRAASLRHADRADDGFAPGLLSLAETPRPAADGDLCGAGHGRHVYAPGRRFHLPRPMRCLWRFSDARRGSICWTRC